LKKPVRSIVVILVAVILLVGARVAFFSPLTLDAARDRILRYREAQNWIWERQSTATFSGHSDDDFISKTMKYFTGRSKKPDTAEYEFTDGTGTIIVRIEHSQGVVEQIEVTGIGTAPRTEKELVKHLKDLPGWQSFRITSPKTN
jgi:hypothetical protein